MCSSHSDRNWVPASSPYAWPTASTSSSVLRSSAPWAAATNVGSLSMGPRMRRIMSTAWCPSTCSRRSLMSTVPAGSSAAMWSCAPLEALADGLVEDDPAERAASAPPAQAVQEAQTSRAAAPAIQRGRRRDVM